MEGARGLIENCTFDPSRGETRNAENVLIKILERRKLCMRFRWLSISVTRNINPLPLAFHCKLKPEEQNMNSYIYYLYKIDILKTK